MPPEQAAGKVAEIGPAADVYALGAILYAMLTGRPPFLAASPMDTLLQVLDKDPVAPRQLNPAVPLDLETIILKCLEKQPSRRYPSAQHLAEELTRFLEGRPILARPVSAAERAWRMCRRHPAIASLTAGIAATLVIATVVSWSYAVQADKQARVALDEKQRAEVKAKEAQDNAQRADLQTQVAEANVQRADEKTEEVTAKEKRANDLKFVSNRFLYAARMNLAQAAWEQTRVGEMVRLLELSRPAEGEEGNSDDLRGFEWHYWDRLCHSSLLDLKGHTEGVTSVTFSADGKRLASASGDGTVKVWDATSGQEMLTLNGHTAQVNSVAFSSDGKMLASASDDKTVKVWDATTGQETLTLKGHTDYFDCVAFSPDGNRLASVGRNQSVGRDHTVTIWDVVSGQETLTLKGHTNVVFSVVFSPDGKRLASASADATVKVWDTTSGTA